MTIRQTISMLIAGMLLCSAVGCSASKPANTTDPANSAATEEPAKEITKFTGMFNATTDSLYENNEIRDIIAEKTGYKLIKSGQITALKVGRAYRIPKMHVLSYLKLTNAA